MGQAAAALAEELEELELEDEKEKDAAVIGSRCHSCSKFASEFNSAWLRLPKL